MSAVNIAVRATDGPISRTLRVPAWVAREVRDWRADEHDETRLSFILRHELDAFGFTHPGDPALNDLTFPDPSGVAPAIPADAPAPLIEWGRERPVWRTSHMTLAAAIVVAALTVVASWLFP